MKCGLSVTELAFCFLRKAVATETDTQEHSTDGPKSTALYHNDGTQTITLKLQLRRTLNEN